MDNDERKSWERQPGEMPKAYAAFCVYRDLLDGRSLVKAYNNRPNRGTRKARRYAPGTWKRWHSDNDWLARATDYDDYLEGLTRAEREELWLTRRRELAEQDWNVGQRLREQVEALLAELPKFIKKSEATTTAVDDNGNKVVTRVITLRLNATITQLATALVKASELQRLAVSVPKTRGDITTDDEPVFIEIHWPKAE